MNRWSPEAEQDAHNFSVALIFQRKVFICVHHFLYGLFWHPLLILWHCYMELTSVFWWVPFGCHPSRTELWSSGHSRVWKFPSLRLTGWPEICSWHLLGSAYRAAFWTLFCRRVYCRIDAILALRYAWYTLRIWSMIPVFSSLSTEEISSVRNPIADTSRGLITECVLLICGSKKILDVLTLNSSWNNSPYDFND